MPDCVISIELMVKSDKIMHGPINIFTFTDPLSDNIKAEILKQNLTHAVCVWEIQIILHILIILSS